MHTSTILKAEHFTYAMRGPDGGWREATFDDFCPGWHVQDRVAVVAPLCDVGFRLTAGAMLALTTRFYDHHRATGRDFFDYPQHYVVMGEDSRGVITQARRDPPLTLADAAGPWTQLDTWPSNKWHTAAPHPISLLKAVFDLQADRVFWPHDALAVPSDGTPRLPGYMAKMLRTHLKQVWLYDVPAPLWRVNVDRAAGGDVLRLAVKAMSDADPAGVDAMVEQMRDAQSQPFRFAEMSVDAFIDRLSPVFFR